MGQRRIAFRRMVKRDNEVEDILKAAVNIHFNITDTVVMVLNSRL